MEEQTQNQQQQSTKDVWLADIGFNMADPSSLVTESDNNEAKYELQNPQLQVATLGNDIVEPIQPITIDSMEDMSASLTNTIDSYNAFMSQQNEKYEPQETPTSTPAPMVEPVSHEQPVATNVSTQVTTNTTTSPDIYPKTQYINRESFSRFVNALSILKNLKQNIIFDSGIAQFVSDSKSYVCKFDIHCPEISFKIPFVEQQAAQLSFLTKGDSISLLESQDDYIFSDGQFKFQLRKTISDNDTWTSDIYNRFYQDITSKPLIAEYEFTDQSYLNNFLSIIKGIKRGNLGFVTSDDMKSMIISRGDVNSGKFELLTIPCNIGATNNQPIDSVFDSVAILQDYLSLKFQFYYNNDDADSISIVMSGTIAGGYDITFISTAYRQFSSSLIA
jgi:hypothetical protein|nr:MAG TPA: hypothetical protein [Caudoviricetes sp.]